MMQNHGNLYRVNALSGWYLISTGGSGNPERTAMKSVNALSGWYLISTYQVKILIKFLSLVSMPSRADTSFLQNANGYPCGSSIRRVNALSGWYLISTNHAGGTVSSDGSRVSMPSRADTSFLRRNSIAIHRSLWRGVNALSGWYLISTNLLKK